MTEVSADQNVAKPSKSDAQKLLIDLITDVIKKKGEFRPEDLDPDQLKMFKNTHKLVEEMKRMGIAPPRVNLLNSSTDETDGASQKLPGNNKPKEKFDRKNRYGVYGDNNWSKMVDLYYDNPNYKNPGEKQRFHIEPYNERFVELDDEIQNYKNLAVNEDLASSPAYKPDKLKVEDYEAPYTKVHLDYEKQMEVPQPARKQIYSKESASKAKTVPGIVNSQKKIEEVKLMQIKRRSTAATKIQKVYKGVLARRQFKKLVQKKNIQDEEDYGYFEVTEQGVKQFLENHKRKKLDHKAVYFKAIYKYKIYKFNKQFLLFIN